VEKGAKMQEKPVKTAFLTDLRAIPGPKVQFPTMKPLDDGNR
jgi:hypothetical protein